MSAPVRAPSPAKLDPDVLRRCHQALDLITQGMSVRRALVQIGLGRLQMWEYCARPGAPLEGHYVRARELQADALADDLLEIADASEGQDSDGVNAARLRVDTRKWLASKILPKRYGEKVQHDVSVTQRAYVVNYTFDPALHASQSVSALPPVDPLALPSGEHSIVVPDAPSEPETDGSDGPAPQG